MIVDEDEVDVSSIDNFNLNTGSGSESGSLAIDGESFELHVHPVFEGVAQVREQMKG
ncbi:MAG: hypothetical protein ABEI86_01030 [Halobacteriaceae archaeon]